MMAPKRYILVGIKTNVTFARVLKVEAFRACSSCSGGTIAGRQCHWTSTWRSSGAGARRYWLDHGDRRRWQKRCIRDLGTNSLWTFDRGLTLPQHDR